MAARSVLLVGVDPIPAGTALRCELRLKNGQPLVVAEGTAVKHVEATPSRPAGLVVRYKRMSSASSDFVRRAVARAAEGRTESSPTSASSPIAAASVPPPKRGGASGAPPKRLSGAPPRRPASEPPTRAEHGVSTEQATSSTRTSSRRSSVPAGRASAHLGLKRPSERKVSVAPSAKRASTLPPGKAAVASHGVSNAPTRDSGAMQRLRSRGSTKAFSSPPDREAILARLKKKSGR